MKHIRRFDTMQQLVDAAFEMDETKHGETFTFATDNEIGINVNEDRFFTTYKYDPDIYEGDDAVVITRDNIPEGNDHSTIDNYLDLVEVKLGEYVTEIP